MEKLPTVFVSHGSPMHALQPGAVRSVWQGIARRLPRPKAIVMSSAHWEADAPLLTGSARPETIHDFYNFPPPLYEIQYPSPGAPDVAVKAFELLKQAKLNPSIDPARGLDHGAWSPLLHMYPEADIPVIQVSVQPHLGPRHHLDIGRALAPLAGEGILLFGSGHMTHNLRDMDRTGRGAVAPYARDFQSWTNARIQSGNLEELVNYRQLNPNAVRAHPTDEHFLPLFFALGAAPEGYKAEHLHDGIEMGALAMDAYLFH